MDLGLMAMKGYSTLPRSPELKPHHQIQFNIIPRMPVFLGWVGDESYSSLGDIVSSLYIPIGVYENKEWKIK